VKIHSLSMIGRSSRWALPILMIPRLRLLHVFDGLVTYLLFLSSRSQSAFTRSGTNCVWINLLFLTYNGAPSGAGPFRGAYPRAGGSTGPIDRF
jgi:hypothetical protein